MIWLYKVVVSPLLPNSCRFLPTCSTYTIQAIEIHGVGKGGWLGFKRICRCHPCYKGELLDPVPMNKQKETL